MANNKMNAHYPTALMACGLALTFLAGCSRSEQTGNEQKSETSITANTVVDSYKDAAATTKEYVTENKDEFVAAADKRVSELDTNIAKLAQKSVSYKDDGKVQADKILADLHEQRDKLKTKLDELNKSGADGWKDIKAGFASALEGLEKAYENAKSQFN
jgi:ElaB/YqjD/DUF883 family membrane-anchored ribosome-binding protein